MLNFPTYLRSYWIVDSLHNGSSPISYDTDIIKIITDLNITYNQGSNWIKKIDIVFVSDYSKENWPMLCKISEDKKLQDISIWVYKNIILNLLKDTQLTTSIKIRIASNMLRVTLNNDDLYKHCADSLVYNIKQLQNAILDVQLPFQAPASL